MRKQSLSSEWYRGCETDEARRSRKGLVAASTPVLDVLYALVEGRKAELLGVREQDYDAAAWSHKQAHRNGRIEELDRLSTLLRSAIDQ